MRRNYRFTFYVIAVLSSLVIIFPDVCHAQKDKRAELLEKIKKLEAERNKIRQEATKTTAAVKPKGDKLEEDCCPLRKASCKLLSQENRAMRRCNLHSGRFVL